MNRNAATRGSRTYLADEAHGESIAAFIRVLDEGGMTGRPALVAADGRRFDLPEELFDVLRQVAESLSAGMGVSVTPLSALLTTQEAADHLGVSRPTLVKILERGDIPMEKPGRHRYVRLQDLLKYQQASRDEQRAAIDALVSDAEEDNLYAATDRRPPRTR